MSGERYILSPQADLRQGRVHLIMTRFFRGYRGRSVSSGSEFLDLVNIVFEIFESRSWICTEHAQASFKIGIVL